MKILVIKTSNNVLNVPYESDREALTKIENGTELSVTIKRERNIKHHRKLFAIFKCVVENNEKYKAVDELLDVVKIAMKYFKIVETLDGKKYLLTKSINFETMGQTNFEKFYANALRILADYISVTPQELEDNAVSYQ